MDLKQFLRAVRLIPAGNSMPESEYMSHKNRNKKRAVGVIAIALLLLFTVLAIMGYINFLVWVMADLIVAAVANLLFRHLGRVPL
jgi:hypothetical protein